MRYALATLGLVALTATAHAQGQHFVTGHFTRSGTFVPGHFQTDPDATRANNWSSAGNTNPYTGRAGSKTYAAPVYTPAFRPPNYQPYKNTWTPPAYTYRPSTASVPVYRPYVPPGGRSGGYRVYRLK